MVLSLFCCPLDDFQTDLANRICHRAFVLDVETVEFPAVGYLFVPGDHPVGTPKDERVS